MQNDTYIPDAMLHDILLPNFLQIVETEEEIPPHIGICNDTYVNYTNKSTKYDQYPCFDKMTKTHKGQIGKS